MVKMIMIGKMFATLDLMLPNEAFDGPMQMAIDEVLLKQDSRSLLRIYKWESPCVTYGYFQKQGEVRALYPTLPSVRRWTGGGIVEHGNDLTFSLMIPSGNEVASIPPAHFYQKLHHALAEMLKAVYESNIQLAGANDILSGVSCFQAPSCNDLLWNGQKILGGAQRRSAGAMLYQGSLQPLPLDFDLEKIGAAMAEKLSARMSRSDLDEAVELEAERLAQSRYRSQAWNERR